MTLSTPLVLILACGEKTPRDFYRQLRGEEITYESGCLSLTAEMYRYHNRPTRVLKSVLFVVQTEHEEKIIIDKSVRLVGIYKIGLRL